MSTTVVRTRLAVAAGVIAILATACNGSSSPSAGNSPATSPTTAASTPTTAASTPSTSSPSTAVTTPNLSGLSSSNFCSYAQRQEADAAKEEAAITGDSPQQLQAYVNAELAVLKQIVSSAPSAVQAAVKTLDTADNQLFAALKAAHYKYQDLNPSSFADIATSAVKQAALTLTSYIKNKCGISTSPNS